LPQIRVWRERTGFQNLLHSFAVDRAA